MPCLIRWPGVIKPGTIVNDICAHEDFIPTFAAAAGEPDLVEKLMKGTTLNGKTFKVHLDGYNLLPFFKGEAKESPREDFLYWSDDGDLMALRVRDWKVAFMEQHTEMNPETPLGVWQGQFTKLRVPNAVQPARRSIREGPRTAYITPTGWRTGRSCSCRRRPSSRSGWRASRSSRRAPRRRASPSATRWSKSRPTRPRTDGVAFGNQGGQRRQRVRASWEEANHNVRAASLLPRGEKGRMRGNGRRSLIVELPNPSPLPLPPSLLRMELSPAARTAACGCHLFENLGRIPVYLNLI